jgi:3-dehydrocarnitine:acetyl-CoA trimethylamine transferase
MLPPGSPWAAFGISRWQFPMAAQAVILGGHVRVGLEDNLYLERGKLSPGNAPLVERAVQIIESIGEKPATVAEAREVLGLGKGVSGRAADRATAVS